MSEKIVRFARDRAWFGVILGLGLMAGMAHAQEVRLSGLLDLAMTRHPTILQARSQAQAAGFDLDSAKWGRFPTLSTELRSDSTYTQSVAKVEQPLWAGGRIEGRIAVGQSNFESANANVRDAQLNALSQVAGAFFESVRLKSRLQRAAENVLEHQRLLGMIERRIAAQVSPPADGTLAQARLQQAMTEQLQMQRQLETNFNNLVQWAGPIKGELTPPAQVAYARQEAVSQAVEMARQASGQRSKLLAQIESARAQIEVAQAQALPTVVAGLQHILSGPMPYGMDRNRGYVGLQFQPGAGLSAISGIKSAQAKKDGAEHDLQTFERTLESNVSTLYGEIDVLQSQLGPARLLSAETAELVDSYLRQYQVGRKNWLDVLNALREKTQALYNHIDVQNTLMLSQVRLLLLTGQLDGQNVSVIHE